MTGKSANQAGHLYLVDGSSYIFRAYHALPPMTRSDGTPVNAVYGFSSMLFKLLEDLNEGDQPTHFAVIFDAARRSFRNDIYPEYKANRPPAPEDLVPQFPLIREATEAFNAPCIELDGFEADDIIATLTRRAREKDFAVTIVSTDKDLMQLVGPGVEMLDTMRNRHIGPKEVHEKFGVKPEKVIEVQALAGDSTDNIPGVPGIGVKTAALLIDEYGDVETLLKRAQEIKQPKRRENLIEFAEQARVSHELVTLHPDVPLEFAIDDLKVREIAVEPLAEFLDEQEFKSLLSRIKSRIGGIDEGDAAQAEIEVKEVDYECVRDVESLKRWIADIEREGIVAVDTETTSLDAMRAELVGISLSLTAGKACYIPLRHRAHDGLALDGDTPTQIPVADAVKLLKPVLEDPAILKVGQNIKYDYLIFLNEGIALHPIDDTMLISYVLESGLHGHGMDELAELHLGHKTIPFKEVAGSGKSQVTFDKVAIDKATDYAAEDADITGRLYRILRPQMVPKGLLTVYETLERPLVPVLARMEQTGVKVDRTTLKRLSGDFAQRMAELEEEIHKLAGHPFNIASPKQLGEVLFDEMSLSGGKRGKTGAYSTGADVLERLASEGHDLPARVLDWRQLAKLKSTYTDSLQESINEVTGRVHTSYAMAATSTGRLASTDPNLQNIPVRTEEGRKIREAFVAESGFSLLSADYSQIELRIVAHMAEADALKKAFERGEDIHARTASEVFGVPIEGMDPSVRRNAKAINFGIIYGISAFGLARQLGISRGEAQEYIDTYFERFPGIRAYMEKTKEDCRKTGYVTTLFDRRCHIRAIRDKNPSVRGFGERAAINAPIQGTAADIIRRAMIQMPGALKKAGLDDVRMLLQVHDELIFEVPDGLDEAAKEVIAKTMENAALPVLELSVPLVVDCGVGSNWNQAH